MINLLQGNIKMESQRTNCTFGFLPTCLPTVRHISKLKKPKSLSPIFIGKQFFANARQKSSTLQN